MNYPLREGLPIPPERIAKLPIDSRGFPVPRFVALINGSPDHRVIDPPYLAQATRFSQCWICGEKLGAYKTFLIGPMCTINRVSSEPPSHRDCADYAAKACPFLTKPHMRRREAGLPEELTDPAGGFIKRNPGVTCAWTTRGFTAEVHPRGDGERSLLFFIDEPTDMQWYCEGRPATREEILDSVVAGLPALRDIAEKEGARALLVLGKQTGEMMTLLDKFPPGAAA